MDILDGRFWIVLLMLARFTPVWHWGLGLCGAAVLCGNWLAVRTSDAAQLAR